MDKKELGFELVVSVTHPGLTNQDVLMILESVIQLGLTQYFRVVNSKPEIHLESIELNQ